MRGGERVVFDMRKGKKPEKREGSGRARSIWTGMVLPYVITVLMAVLLAIDYDLFIVENNFAPAGLNGLATMIQYMTGFSIGYMALLINIPLCILAFFLVDRQFAIRSFVFVLVYSGVYIFLQHLDLSFLRYCSNGHNTIFPAIISGVIGGFVGGVTIKYGSSTGGTDIISKYINKVRPEFNFFLVAFIMNTAIAIMSLFVYSGEGQLSYEPVALCITYCFISFYVANYLVKGTKTAYKFTVVTEHPDEIIADINRIIRHGATKVTASGGYTNTEKTILICVVNKHQVVDFKDIVDRYDRTFSFCEVVTETYGNFVKIK